MPTYVYKFLETGETIEVQQSFADDDPDRSRPPADRQPRWRSRRSSSPSASRSRATGSTRPTVAARRRPARCRRARRRARTAARRSLDRFDAAVDAASSTASSASESKKPTDRRARRSAGQVDRLEADRRLGLAPRLGRPRAAAERCSSRSATPQPSSAPRSGSSAVGVLRVPRRPRRDHGDDAVRRGRGSDRGRHDRREAGGVPRPGTAAATSTPRTGCRSGPTCGRWRRSACVR